MVTLRLRKSNLYKNEGKVLNRVVQYLWSPLSEIKLKKLKKSEKCQKFTWPNPKVAYRTQKKIENKRLRKIKKRQKGRKRSTFIIMWLYFWSTMKICNQYTVNFHYGWYFYFIFLLAYLNIQGRGRWQFTRKVQGVGITTIIWSSLKTKWAARLNGSKNFKDST